MLSTLVAAIVAEAVRHRKVRRDNVMLMAVASMDRGLRCCQRQAQHTGMAGIVQDLNVRDARL